MKLSSAPFSSLVLTALPVSTKPASKDTCNHSESSTLTEPVTNFPVTQPQKSQQVEEQRLGIWKIFSSTFITIFLAEMGDKTQLATLLMSAESQSPWTVFAGAAAALIATSLIGVLIGRWLSLRLSPKTLERAAAALLIFISATLLWDVMTF